MQGAIDYICAHFNCSPISTGGQFFFPDNVQDHASWAINAWYMAHPINPTQSCNFGNTAKLMCANCSCELFSNATQQGMQNALDYICSNMDCTPIEPGGQFYQPNTLPAHTAWGVNAWWEAHIWTVEACNFGGIAYLTPPACDGSFTLKSITK